MPRLTHSTYSAQHEVLHELWLRSDGGAYSVLSANEQWDLHDFFAISATLSEAELREHRRLKSAADPSLPHRAGRALKKLIERQAERAEEQEALQAAKAAGPAPAKRKYRKNVNRKIRVESVVHPQPDVQKFARALMELAKEMAKKEQEERKKRDAA